MRLSELAASMRGVEVAGQGDPAVLGITVDSRAAGDGFVFAAVAGCTGDGAAYIDDAVKRGATSLITSCIPARDPGVPYIVAEDVRKAVGEAADVFYDHPAQTIDLAGITGTNGKTTTAYLLRHILNASGKRAGMLGTIEYDLGDSVEPAPLTTPDAVRFTRSLAAMRDAGCGAAVVEVSSHALDQHRVWPHRFAVAVFTNLTRDHLDYHGDMDAYREAKRSLFLRLDEQAAAVFNFRDPAATAMAQGCRARIFGYYLSGGGDESFPDLPGGILQASISHSDLSGQRFRVAGYGLDREFTTPLVGRHNVENSLGAILAAIGLGVRPHTIAEALASFPGVPGRLERVESADGIKAFVDYSHTDDALRSVLSVLRPLVKGRLITVFGCGGDRDPGKRPLMAKAAEAYSDRVVVTSDNPRTEDPEAIIDAVMQGFDKPDLVVREADRPTAVRVAVSMAGPDDAILVAGKGHEDYQIVGTTKRHMDDRELVRAAFAGKTAGGAE